MTLTSEEERIRQTLTSQEAKVIMVMRELPHQIIYIKMENSRVMHKQQIKNIKD